MHKEPYRFLFPLGTLFLMVGVGLWILPALGHEIYPVKIHRYFMINGLMGCFVAGFLMTAIPQFSKSFKCKYIEVIAFGFVTVIGGIFSYFLDFDSSYLFGSIQGFLLLIFIFLRVLKRKENPPYSFIFVMAGALIWSMIFFFHMFLSEEIAKTLHQEGVFMCMILGIGSRLFPGILGHSEIVSTQKKTYEVPGSMLSTVPRYFFLLPFIFLAAYVFPEFWKRAIQTVIVFWIAIKYWKIFSFPRNRNSLTYCLWITTWLIPLSFFYSCFRLEDGIHSQHAIFIGSFVLVTSLIAIRVLQAHGPKDKEIESSSLISLITSLILLSAILRVLAFYQSDHYFGILALSAIILLLAIVLWSIKFLKFIFVLKDGEG